MRRQPQRMSQREKRTSSVLPAILAVGAIARAHQRCAKRRPFVGPFPAVRQRQRVTEFMADAADKNRVVAPQRDVPVLPVVHMRRLLRQPVEIQNRRIHLPRRAAAIRAARVVRAVLRNRPLLRVPIRHVAKNHNRLLRHIDARLLQHRRALRPNLLTALRLIVRIRPRPAHHVNIQQPVRHHIQPDGPRPKAHPLHLLRIKAPDISEDFRQPFAIKRRRLAVIRRPKNDMQLAVRALRVLRLPAIQNRPRRRHLRPDLRPRRRPRIIPRRLRKSRCGEKQSCGDGKKNRCFHKK